MRKWNRGFGPSQMADLGHGSDCRRWVVAIDVHRWLQGIESVKLALQIGSKLLRFVGAVIAVSFFTFLLSHQIPGDPTVIILQSNVNKMVPCGSPFLGMEAVDCSVLSPSVIQKKGDRAAGPGGTTCDAQQCVIASDLVRHQLHLDESIPKQYLRWASGAVHGDFGLTFEATPVPVWPSIAHALPPTLELMIMASIIALVLAIPLGIYSAYRENKLGDRITTGGASCSWRSPTSCSRSS